MKNVQPGIRDTYKSAFQNLLENKETQCTTQQTKLQLNDSRFIIEIMIQVAAERWCVFTEGTRRYFICWANLTHNYTLRPQGLILLVN